MPKFNLYQSLHTTVIGPEGRPLEIQIRTREMHEHGRVRRRRALALQGGHDGAEADRRRSSTWLRQLLDWQQDDARPAASSSRRCTGRPVRGRGLRLHAEGRGQVARRRRDAARLRLRVHTDVGHRCVGAKVNGKIVPLHYQLQTRRHRRDPHLEAGARPVARLARAGARPRARATRSAPGSSARRARTPSTRAASCSQETLKQAGPAAAEARRLAAARRRDPRDGLQKADDFYIALGRAKISAKAVVNKVMQRLKTGRGGRGADGRRRSCSSAATSAARDRGVVRATASTSRASTTCSLRLAKCCRPVPGDPIVGYISLGRGITIHREDCPNVEGADARTRSASPPVAWDGDNETSLPGRDPGRRAGTATACSRTSRAPSPRPASTSSRPAASSSTRWSRTASWSRSATPQALKACDHAPAQRRRRSSTPTASRRRG